MTHIADKLTAEELPLEILESNWEAIRKVAHEIADEVDIKSEGLSGNFFNQALYVSDFFRSGPNHIRALNQPTVLAIANPLARLANNQELTKREIAKAVSMGLCTLARHGSAHRSLLRVFIYPILLTYFWVFAVILGAHFITPYFEEIFVEFGIMVPGATSMIFGLAYLVRVYTFTILLVFLGLPPLLWLVNMIGRNNRPPGMSRLDMLLSRKRPSAARWLFHFSLLLEAGLSKEDAIVRVGAISGKRWIQNRTRLWQKKTKSDYPDPNIRFFGRQKYRTADVAIDVPRSRGQVALLQQVATWYRDSSSNIMEWFVQLLVPIYVFLILFGLAVFVLSILMPFIAVIGGLTGGGPGGFM